MAGGGDDQNQGREEEREEEADGGADGGEPGAVAGFDARGGFNVAHDRRGAEERAENGGERVGDQRAARFRERAAGAEETGAFGDADEGVDVVEHIDNQQRQHDRQRLPKILRDEIEVVLEHHGLGVARQGKDSGRHGCHMAAFAVGDEEADEGDGGDQEHDGAGHAAGDEHGGEDDAEKGECDRRRAKVTLRDEGGFARDDDAGVFQTDESDEQTDAAGDGDFERIGDRVDDLLADTGEREEEKHHAVGEDEAERGLPWDAGAETNGIGKIGVIPMPGARANGKLVMKAMSSVLIAAVTAVTVTSAAWGMPASFRISGLTARMQAIDVKVVRPA